MHHLCSILRLKNYDQGLGTFGSIFSRNIISDKLLGVSSICSYKKSVVAA